MDKQQQRPCPFCEELKSKRNIAKFKNAHPWYYGGKFKEEYSTAILTRKWQKDTPKRDSQRIIDCGQRECGYKLNFCPTCGKKVVP